MANNNVEKFIVDEKNKTQASNLKKKKRDRDNDNDNSNSTRTISIERNETLTSSTELLFRIRLLPVEIGVPST